jgi:hypothetical protein
VTKSCSREERWLRSSPKCDDFAFSPCDRSWILEEKKAFQKRIKLSAAGRIRKLLNLRCTCNHNAEPAIVTTSVRNERRRHLLLRRLLLRLPGLRVLCVFRQHSRYHDIVPIHIHIMSDYFKLRHAVEHTAQQRTLPWLPTRSRTGAQPPHITRHYAPTKSEQQKIKRLELHARQKTQRYAPAVLPAIQQIEPLAATGAGNVVRFYQVT